MRDSVKLKFHFRLLLLIGILTILTGPVLFPSRTGAQSDRTLFKRDLGMFFVQHENLRLNTAAMAQQVRNSGHLSLSTPAYSFELELVPHDMRASNYRAENVDDSGRTQTLEKGMVNTY